MPGGDISDLDKNRALVAWLRYQLRHAEQRVRDLEHAEQAERRRKQRARAEQLWKIQPRRSAETALLHRGGCGLYTSRAFIDREAAVNALAEPGITPCDVCAPETGLTGAEPGA
ncbi:DUF6233 domain-containing protein [Streptomyces microflavus]|uniref:DUF6233 domain-containing protein n=1 Tax=Streptomyces TaxID=1883 RepID=UPI001A214B96|nr:hypothetical protein [Streptomyces sp. MBT57]WSR88967.1 DUF6233 domain-containing protein [Streptomyces microflavus]WSR95816.1 DUF6233 domain-containing protein [Streptomyces microflavus]